MINQLISITATTAEVTAKVRDLALTFVTPRSSEGESDAEVCLTSAHGLASDIGVRAGERTK